MNSISDVSKLSVVKEQLCYEGKKIGTLFTRTLYHIDPKTQNLQYHNFTIFGLFLHLFGYKKEYNSQNLIDWLTGKKVEVKLPEDGKNIEKVAVQALIVFQEKNQTKLSKPKGSSTENEAPTELTKAEQPPEDQAKKETPAPHYPLFYTLLY